MLVLEKKMRGLMSPDELEARRNELEADLKRLKDEVCAFLRLL